MPPFKSIKGLNLGDAIAGLADHYEVKAPAVFKADAIRHLGNPQGDPIIRSFPEGDFQALVLPSGEIAWKKTVVIAQVSSEPALEDTFSNAGYDWLTYETVQNKIPFRKSNQARDVGLYFVELRHMRVWARDHLPQEMFSVLVESFFPDSSNDDISELSNQTKLWEAENPASHQAASPLRAVTPVSNPGAQAGQPSPAQASAPIVASRGRNGINIGDHRVVLPYNYWDNSIRSHSIGTDGPVGPYPRQLSRWDKAWKLWKTASRSSIMELGRVMPAAALPNQYVSPTWNPWPFKPLNGRDERETFANKSAEKPPTKLQSTPFADEVRNTTHFQLSNRNKYHFSVKTGVCFVGFEDQWAAHKDIIGDWKVGCLRSDYIAQVQEEAKGWPRLNDIAIQTELLTVVERDVERLRDWMAGKTDGISVRDISMMSAGHAYIAPLSIPMLDVDHKKLVSEFHHVSNKVWCDFWRENYAAALGRAKAYFLLRYGLQHGNPNVQNYLLELKKTAGGLEGPARVVIRDVQDASIHREVIWALYGDPTQLPPTTSPIDGATATQLQSLRLLSLSAQFKDAEYRGEETGSTGPMFGPPGTQFGWFRFSAFSNFEKPKTRASVPEATGMRILELMSNWGLAHNAAYVNCVEECLGVEATGILWTEHNEIKQYGNASDKTNYAKELAWEDAASLRVHEALRQQEGQQKIRDYKDRKWEPAPVAFKVKLLNLPSVADGLLKVLEVDRDDGLKSERVMRADDTVPFYEPVGDMCVRVPGKTIWHRVRGMPKDGDTYKLDFRNCH
jgi:hypothetical protein